MYRLALVFWHQYAQHRDRFFHQLNQLPVSFHKDVSLNIDATTYNLILSKKFALITAYGSMGYNSVKTSFSSNTNFQLGSTNVIEFNVPLDMEFESQSVFQAATGVRLQFAIFTVYANQTFSDYPITSAGIGISFR